MQIRAEQESIPCIVRMFATIRTDVSCLQSLFSVTARDQTSPFVDSKEFLSKLWLASPLNNCSLITCSRISDISGIKQAGFIFNMGKFKRDTCSAFADKVRQHSPLLRLHFEIRSLWLADDQHPSQAPGVENGLLQNWLLQQPRIFDIHAPPVSKP